MPRNVGRTDKGLPPKLPSKFALPSLEMLGVRDLSVHTMNADSKPPRFITTIPEPPKSPPQDCISCRIIGSGVLAGAGIYALMASRASAPGSVMGKRIVAGIGICKS